MVRSQNYTKLAWGIMTVICWLVPLSLSWTLSLNWRSGITCSKCLFCPLVSLPVWHLTWTFLCVFICGVHAWMHVQLYVLACAFFFLLLLLLWLNTDWGREGRMRKQRQESGKGSWSRDHGGNTVYWLAHRHMISYLFYRPQVHCPRDLPSLVAWACLLSSQWNTSRTYPQAKPVEVIPSRGFFFPRCVKLTFTISYYSGGSQCLGSDCDSLRNQTTLSQGLHTRLPVYQIFTLQFLIVEKLQLWSSNTILLWLGSAQPAELC